MAAIPFGRDSRTELTQGAGVVADRRARLSALEAFRGSFFAHLPPAGGAPVWVLREAEGSTPAVMSGVATGMWPKRSRTVTPARRSLVVRSEHPHDPGGDARIHARLSHKAVSEKLLCPRGTDRWSGWARR